MSKAIIWAVISFILGFTICYLFLRSDSSDMNINWEMGTQKLNIDLKKDAQSYKSIL